MWLDCICQGINLHDLIWYVLETRASRRAKLSLYAECIIHKALSLGTFRFLGYVIKSFTHAWELGMRIQFWTKTPWNKSLSFPSCIVQSHMACLWESLYNLHLLWAMAFLARLRDFEIRDWIVKFCGIETTDTALRTTWKQRHSMWEKNKASAWSIHPRPLFFGCVPENKGSSLNVTL